MRRIPSTLRTTRRMSSMKRTKNLNPISLKAMRQMNPKKENSKMMKPTKAHTGAGGAVQSLLPIMSRLVLNTS
jgi:hypothetical protein